MAYTRGFQDPRQIPTIIKACSVCNNRNSFYFGRKLVRQKICAGSSATAASDSYQNATMCEC